MNCSVDFGRAIQAAQAHSGVGGAGTVACSGDLLLGALAACAQLTCQMVAANMGIAAERIEAWPRAISICAERLASTRRSRSASPQSAFALRSKPQDADAEQIESLIAKTERYCTVLQTL